MPSKPVIALALASLPAASQAGTRQEANVILSDNPQMKAVEEQWGFADAIVAGDTVYLSGVVAGTGAGETNLELAYERAFQQIGKILTRSGATWDDVVDITSFHTDLAS